jgi:hypothetical protein
LGQKAIYNELKEFLWEKTINRTVRMADFAEVVTRPKKLVVLAEQNPGRLVIEPQVPLESGGISMAGSFPEGGECVTGTI